ncbi:MAG: HAMP domain-containing sensor histidine kinase [Bacillota bacterium]|nr:HAMP domain-containing sensor histidine kinase [Bacillota bacterium]
MRLPFPRRLFGRLLFSYVALTFIALLLGSLLLLPLVQNYLQNRQIQQLESDGRQVALVVQDDLAQGASSRQIQRTLSLLRPFLGAEPWVVNRTGVILATTPAFENVVGFRLSDEAVARVLRGETVVYRRPSPQLWGIPVAQKATLSVAVPISQGGRVVGAVFLHRPLEGLEALTWDLGRLVILSLFLAFLLGTGVAAYFSRRLGRPLEELAGLAQEFSSDPERPLGERFAALEQDLSLPQEIRQLSHALGTATEAVARTLEERKRLEEWRRAFIADVSHELRGPLTSLLGFLELWQEGAIDAGEEAQVLQLMQSQGQTLRRLIQDLLDMARLDAGGVQFDLGAVRPFEEAALLFQEFKAQAEEKDLRLQLEGDEDAVCRADPLRLHEVLRNLVTNALRYSPPGGTITLEVKKQGQEVAVHVQDQGPGVPVEFREKVFERFFRSDPSRPAGEGAGWAWPS